MNVTQQTDTLLILAMVDAIRQVTVDRPMPASHVQAFLVIAANQERGTTTQELVDALHMDQSGVKRILDQLSKFGRTNQMDGLDWVYSIDDPKARARKLFLLTAKGQNKVQNMVRCFNVPPQGAR